MEVKITITAEDGTQQTFKAIRENSKTAFDSVKSSAIESAKGTGSAFESLKSSAINTFNNIKGHWLAASAAIAGAIYTINKAWNLAEQAAQFREQKTALNNLAASYGTTADSIINSVRDASDGLISMADATKVASKALMTGLNPAQLVGFMKIVKETTNVTGASVSESFERITYAASTGQERALKQMGIIVDLQGGYKKYAESVNKTAEELTEMEKQQAGINTILGKSSDILKMLGNSEDSTADKMERFKVIIEDVKLLLGEGLVRAGLAVYGVFQGVSAVALLLSAGILKVISAGMAMTDWLGLTTGAYEEYKLNANAALEASMKLGNEAAKNISTLWESTESTTKKIIENKNQIVTATESAAEMTKKEKKAIEEAGDSLLKYSDVITKTGEEVLKFAELDLGKNLESQKKSVSGMEDALKKYLTVVEGVYLSQIAALKEVEKAMNDIKIDPEVIKGQGIKIIEAEKAQAEARLGAWTNYYSVIKSLHLSAIDEQKKKTEELLQLEEKIRLQRQGYADLEKSLQEKIWGAASQGEVEKYYSTQYQLNQKLYQAEQLTGQAKIDALTEYQKEAASTSNAVIEDGKEYISLQSATLSALSSVRNAQSLITAEQDKLKAAKQAEIEQTKLWESQLKTAMNEASGFIEKYKTQIVDLRNQMSALKLIIDDSQAISTIQNIKGFIDSIPNITYKTIMMNYASMDGDVSGNYASGTSYVPETGIYQLHQGERVLNRNESANFDNRKFNKVRINLGGITITGSNKDPQVIAKEIARYVDIEFRNLNSLN